MNRSNVFSLAGMVALIALLWGCAAPLSPTTAPTKTATPVLTPTARPAGALVVNEDFSDTSRWCLGSWIGRFPEKEQYCQNGEFHYVLKTTGSAHSGMWGMFKDFIAQIEARAVTDAVPYGLFFRLDNPPGGYYFKVRPTGQYMLSKWLPADQKKPETVLVEWSDSGAIKKGQAVNLLEVIAQGTQITLLANGEQLASTTDATFSVGVIGMTVGEGHAVFDNLKVWDLTRPP